ncbi:AI-2E family transporter [Salinicola sp. MH3R3-1]|uniref:AI-2E family transporter n=1 Tax=Salinicola sp. MH3R3-1 TaxID=1928762 RepID=UPI00094E1F2B|nr:AI-2E family transporter [Salinicola sp. MH3R3-1]OLO06813.1 AI-2E family transporter [Salinicola sp. MH3R3-1]
MAPIFADSSVARWLLVLVMVAGVYFFIDFLIPVLAALIICLASWPLYRRLLASCGQRKTLAASIALGLIILCLVIPMVLASTYAFQELKGWVGWLMVANQHGIPPPAWVGHLPGVGNWLAVQWQDYLAEPHAPEYLIQLVGGEHIGNISRWVLALGSNALHLALTLLFMLITLFFLYKDGAGMARQLDIVGERVLPARWQRFSRVVPATVSSTVMGMGLIALGEGLVLGTAYWIAGIQSPVVLGVITAFMALVPGGAPLTFTLVSLYLLATGHMINGVGLFIWGAFELFIGDKTLRPRLVGGPIKLPFLPTFFGLIGGVKTMGIVGLFVGPVLMALLVASWREWLHDDDAPDAPSEAERWGYGRRKPIAQSSGGDQASSSDEASRDVSAMASTNMDTNVDISR